MRVAETVRWNVCKYYTATKDLTVTVGVFINEEDAREYYCWKKSQLARENKKRAVPRGFVWQLCKHVQTFDERGERNEFVVVED